jgi:16S rRNA U1498 N3-methylase RsmE
MKVGDNILVSRQNFSDLCEIVEISASQVAAKIIEENFQDTSLKIN